MRLNTLLRQLAFIVLTGIAAFGNSVPGAAQGCGSVDIAYHQPDCYHDRKGGSAGSPNGPQACIPVAACVGQSNNYSAQGGPWASYLWAVISGPATPAITPGANVANISITWPVVGVYVLKLIVTDGSGNTYTKCLEVSVKDRPVAGFTFSPNGACAGSVVNFTNATTFSGTPAYSWDFGDPASGANNASSLINPTHIFGTAGSYTVTLIAYSTMLVYGGGGSATGGGVDSLTMVTCCADTIRKTVTVVNGNVKIDCIATVCAGAVVKYTAIGCSPATWGTPVGGTTLASTSTTITVQWGSGNPQGQLSVSCAGGCTAYANVPIVPSAPVIVGSTTPCNASSSVYSLPLLPGTTYTWTLQDVTVGATANSLLSTFPDNNTVWVDWSLATPGDTYQLTINLNNKHLCCTSTGSLTITPKGRYSISGPATICAGQSGFFFPNQASTFLWGVTPTAGVTPFTGSGSTFTANFSIPAIYTIVANAPAGAFCNNSASTTALVIPVPTPGAIVGPNTGCIGPANAYAYSVTTPAPSGYYYEWTIAGGSFQPGGSTTITGDNVTVQWTSLPGTISLTLKQSSSPYCSAPALPLTVNAATVGTVSGPTSVCVDGTAVYTLTGGTIPPGTFITWGVAPGAQGSIVSPQGGNTITILWHGGAGPGPWTGASVTATTDCGPAMAQMGITIYPKFSVTATLSGPDVCNGGATLTANGAPPASAYVWSPGGATTQVVNGVTLPGNYAVTATKGGCSASANVIVPVAFEIAPEICGLGYCVTGGATNQNIKVKVLKPGSGTFSYIWRQGSCLSPGAVLQTQTSSLTSNNYLALSDGLYNVQVVYGTCTLCVDIIVPKVCCPDVNNPQIISRVQNTCEQYTFIGTCNPTSSTITWDFGDGTSDTGTSNYPEVHTYTTPGVYCVTFCVGSPTPNPTACVGNCAVTDAVVPLAAGFLAQMACSGCVTVQNNTAIYGPTGPPVSVSYFWDFGDGFTTTNANPAPHCYATAGMYLIQLKVTYTNGTVTCIKTLIQNVTYTPLTIAAPTPVCSGTLQTFSSTPVFPLTSTWAFGDGFTGYISPIPHAYASTGSFTINLSVVDAFGNVCTATKPINVDPGVSGCSILPAYLCPGQAATIIGPVGAYTYQWQVEISPGIFTPAPGINITANYTTLAAGNYRVIVNNAFGCSCTSNVVSVSAAPRPKASFDISPSKNICLPGDVVTLTAPLLSGHTYQWFMGGTPISGAPPGNVVSTYVSGSVTFHLILTNEYGCKDTCSQTVTVAAPPAAPNIISSGLCAGVPVICSVTNWASNITWNTGAAATSIVVYSAGAYIATYTDPVTGCSASSQIVINKRPSAGLFPQLCDSIPCKCIRPFAIYAPNPLIGLFASTYTINWYDGISNALLFTGNPYNNGGLGAQTGSYYVVITDNATGCKDTSNRYSIVVPPCDTCDCKSSTWGSTILEPANNGELGYVAPVKMICGKTYTLECNKAYKLSTSFNCKDSTCKGKVTYSLLSPIGSVITGSGPVINFTLSINGTYTLTLYGWCGAKVCDSCVIRLKVVCPCDCKGSKWGPIVLTQPVQDGDPAGAIIAPAISLNCGKTYTLDCRKTYSINPTFICKDTTCKGKVTYTIQPPSGTPLSGSAPLSFTPVINGTYTLTLYGWCGEFKCDSCVIKFDVVCGCDCAQSTWGNITLTPMNDVLPHDGIVAEPVAQIIKCGKSYTLACYQAYSIDAIFNCKDTACKGKVTYKLISPSGPAITGNAPLSITPTITGTYTLTLYGWCGDAICDSCIIKFTVDCTCDCKGSKWELKTLSNGVTSSSLQCNNYTYPWECRQPFTINAKYNCAKAFCSDTTSYILTPPVGPAITGNLPLTYTPTLTGTYKVVIYGYCGGVICDSCVSNFKVECIDTVCCQYDIKVAPGTQSLSTTPAASIVTQAFSISGLSAAPLTEVRAEVLSYDISSNFGGECMACKMYPYLWASINSAGNIGAVPALIQLYSGATTSLFNPSGTAVYQNPREVIWNNGSIFSINAPLTISFFLPPPPLIDCCALTAKVCVKFTFRDVSCRECEVIACFEVALKK